MTTAPQATSRAFYDRVMELDRKGALALAERYLGERGDLLDLYDEVLGPAMTRAGAEWQSGRISVAHEHYLSEVVHDAVRRLGRDSSAELPAGAPVAVACCAPRERHSIGLLMVADALRAGGVEVHLLGESLPAEAVVGFLRQADAELFCLSCALDIHLRAAADLIARVRKARPNSLVVVGGTAIRDRADELRKFLAADFVGTDARDVRLRLPEWRRCLGNRAGESPTPGPEADGTST